MTVFLTRLLLTHLAGFVLSFGLLAWIDSVADDEHASSIPELLVNAFAWPFTLLTILAVALDSGDE